MAKIPNHIDRQVGSRIRARRRELGMSQTDVSVQLGLAFQQVQKYEKGINRVGSGRLQHIASILQVPIEFFFDYTPGGKAKAKAAPPDFVDEFLVSAEGHALARAFGRIPDAKLRRNLVNSVKSIAEQREPD